MFVISGVTGNTGSTIAHQLIDQGQAVRVIVRSPEKGIAWKALGAEVAVAELTDIDALTSALQGATGAYFLLPPDLHNEHFLEDSNRRADAIVAASLAARLPHAVILSSVGAQHRDRVGPITTIGRMERLFIDAAIPVTAIRPGYFLENIMDVLPAAIHDGVYPSMILPLDHKIDMVATRDIGLTAAHALLHPPSEAHRVIELRGADQYSAIDIAQALSEKLGGTITPVPVPREEWEATLSAAGLSRQGAETMAEMHDNINNGRISFLDDNAQKATIDLTTFVEALTV